MKTTLLSLLTLFVVATSCTSSKVTGDRTEDGTPIIYFSRHISGDSILILFERLGIKPEGKVGLKLHFGESGNPNHLSAELSKPLTLAYDATLVETNVAYSGERAKSDTHKALAKRHGFDFAPIDIQDEFGDTTIACDTKHYTSVSAGKSFFDYDSYIIFSHFKGHGSSGYGGAIKNIAMGLASPSGKRAQHSGDIPSVDPEKCLDCGLCARYCAQEAITNRPMQINGSKCNGCGQCVTECPYDALYKIEYSRELFMERLVDYTKGLIAQRPMYYVNVMANISALCDCARTYQKPFMNDVGVVVGTDIVAVEQAAYDLVNKAHGTEDAFENGGKGTGKHQITYAEQEGLGTTKYILIDIDKE